MTRARFLVQVYHKRGQYIESEMKLIISFLETLRPALAPTTSSSLLDISPEDYLLKYAKKFKNEVNSEVNSITTRSRSRVGGGR